MKILWIAKGSYQTSGSCEIWLVKKVSRKIRVECLRLFIVRGLGRPSFSYKTRRTENFAWALSSYKNHFAECFFWFAGGRMLKCFVSRVTIRNIARAISARFHTRLLLLKFFADWVLILFENQIQRLGLGIDKEQNKIDHLNGF